MQINIGRAQLELVLGDITLQEVDAIVNAANSDLSGGGGVDGAIHRRGGPEIMQETSARYPDGCPTGSAVISSAGRIPARFVIHAVGPVWRGGGAGEEEQLASAYRSAMHLAELADCTSIAFPALSAGAYRFPLPAAAAIALRTVRGELGVARTVSLAKFVLFNDEVFEAFRQQLALLLEER